MYSAFFPPREYQKLTFVFAPPEEALEVAGAGALGEDVALLGSTEDPEAALFESDAPQAAKTDPVKARTAARDVTDVFFMGNTSIFR